MSGDPWDFDDPGIADSELLYRRIPKHPDHRTFDAERERWVPTTAALRREADEGMSVHRHAVLAERGRDPLSLYDPATHGSISFVAGVPRSQGAGVVATSPTEDEEPDEDRRASHAEVRPERSEKDRAAWSRVANSIATQCQWVQPVE